MPRFVISRKVYEETVIEAEDLEEAFELACTIDRDKWDIVDWQTTEGFEERSVNE